jgi:hypothetical protein
VHASDCASHSLRLTVCVVCVCAVGSAHVCLCVVCLCVCVSVAPPPGPEGLACHGLRSDRDMQTMWVPTCPQNIAKQEQWQQHEITNFHVELFAGPAAGSGHATTGRRPVIACPGLGSDRNMQLQAGSLYLLPPHTIFHKILYRTGGGSKYRGTTSSCMSRSDPRPGHAMTGRRPVVACPDPAAGPAKKLFRNFVPYLSSMPCCHILAVRFPLWLMHTKRPKPRGPRRPRRL